MAEDVSWDEPKRRGPARKRPRRVSRWVVAFAGVGCVLILVLAMTLRKRVPGRPLEEPPPEAVGHWTTVDPRYADRGLRVGPHEVVLEVGPGVQPLRGRILAVSTWQEDPFTVIHIEYDAGEGAMSLDMMLVGPNRMRLRNPSDVIWTRTG